MVNTTVRIESIEIKNFKNVGYGHLDFEESKKGGRASILGLYGQNGSGKTALIDALELLRLALSGKAIPAYFADLPQREKYAGGLRSPSRHRPCGAATLPRSARRLLLLFYPNSRRIATARLAAPQQA